MHFSYLTFMLAVLCLKAAQLVNAGLYVRLLSIVSIVISNFLSGYHTCARLCMSGKPALFYYLVGGWTVPSSHLDWSIDSRIVHRPRSTICTLHPHGPGELIFHISN